ncbi:MAG: hypothetical protein P0Y51_18890 [Candidatus Pseudomonas colombiensis]|nr:MAG: hypothetical protein P0Y51_18890 [Pseudomonas sp.]
MAEAAGHAHPIGFHQLTVVVIAGVFVIALGVPLLLRVFVKVRVGEQPQANDPSAVAVIGAHWQVLAPRADLDARVFAFVFKGVGGAGRLAAVEPQTEAVLPGAVALDVAGLVDHAQHFPAFVAIEGQAGVVGNGLEQVEVTDTVPREFVPQGIVTGGPDNPVVAPTGDGLDGLLFGNPGDEGGQALHQQRRLFGDAVVHVGVVVLVGALEAGGITADAFGFVQALAGFVAAGVFRFAVTAL